MTKSAGTEISTMVAQARYALVATEPGMSGRETDWIGSEEVALETIVTEARRP